MDKRVVFFAKAFICFVWFLLVYASISDLFTGNGWRTIIWVAFLVISLYAFFGVRRLSLTSNFLLSFIILLDIFGEIIFEIFYHFLYYDKILHFFVPIIMVSIFYDLLGIWYSDKKRRLWYAASITLSLGIFWEIAEVLFAYLFDAPMVGVFIHAPGAKHFFNFGINVMGPVEDIIWDLSLDIAGVILALFFGFRNIKK